MRFWEDSWCSEIPLCDLFPKFYSMAKSRETKVMEVWGNFEQGGGWNFNFEGSFNDWEMDNVESLIGRVRGRKINPLDEDKMVWMDHILRGPIWMCWKGEGGLNLFQKEWFGTSWFLQKQDFLCGKLGGARF